MYTLLQEGVQAGLIDASGWIIGVGGLVLLVLWAGYLAR
jgi:polynucleotide 5'-kinase involved in rRNA processing